MKQPKDGGRLLADVGKERKLELYKRLLDMGKSYKEWLIQTIDKFLKESEVR